VTKIAARTFLTIRTFKITGVCSFFLSAENNRAFTNHFFFLSFICCFRFFSHLFLQRNLSNGLEKRYKLSHRGPRPSPGRPESKRKSEKRRESLFSKTHKRVLT